MIREYTIQEFRGMVGRTFGVSEWVDIGQQEINRFAEATGDLQWIHTDPGRAKDGPFKSTVAHGMMTLSLLPRLMASIYRLTDAALLINYGFNRVRFPAPVPSGSRVRSHAELVSFEADGDAWRSTVRSTIEVEGKEKPACVAENVVMVVPFC